MSETPPAPSLKDSLDLLTAVGGAIALLTPVFGVVIRLVSFSLALGAGGTTTRLALALPITELTALGVIAALPLFAALALAVIGSHPDLGRGAVRSVGWFVTAAGGALLAGRTPRRGSGSGGRLAGAPPESRWIREVARQGTRRRGQRRPSRPRSETMVGAALSITRRRPQTFTSTRPRLPGSVTGRTSG